MMVERLLRSYFVSPSTSYQPNQTAQKSRKDNESGFGHVEFTVEHTEYDTLFPTDTGK